MKSVCMAAFPDLYVMRWLSLFLKHVFPRSRLNARAYYTLGFSHPYPQHLVQACHTPSHPALPYIQCLHSLHGHSNLHMGSEILCIKYLRIQDLILNRSPGPLIKLSMKSSDYSWRRCVLHHLKITLPPNLSQELNFLCSLVQLHYQFSLNLSCLKIPSGIFKAN